MGITNLSKICNEQAVMDPIAVCKSDSGKCGTSLRNAHQTLGVFLGKLISNQEQNANKYAVIVLMRAGLPFGLGVADGLEIGNKHVRIFFYTENTQCEISVCEYDRIILADAVIESGDSILKVANELTTNDNIIFVTNVLSSKALPKFRHFNLYTVRVSENSFKGSEQKIVQNGKGPDTGERLFDSNFL
jgi:uracil phosphoribosyltransferase